MTVRLTVRRTVAAAVASVAWCGLSVLPVGAVPVVESAPVQAPTALAPGRASPDGLACTDVQRDTQAKPVEGDNPAYDDLHVEQAHDLARTRGVEPGAGVSVVVVDSGVAPGPDLQSAHGPIVAGLLTGRDQRDPALPVGIAPAAELRDVRYYDVLPGESDDSARRPQAGTLAAALRTVRPSVTPRSRTIVLVPATVDPSGELRSAVRSLVEAGALVVAPVGDRPDDETEPALGDFHDGPRPGEDAAGAAWPAGEDGVVAVGASLPGALAAVVRSSGVDLAAPGGDTVSYGLNGRPCVLPADRPSSHWAAAQVAGVAALVWSVHGDDSARELRARLEATASGNGAPHSAVIGHGVVQPVEALQRRPQGRAPAADGELVERAKPPRERADLLATTRQRAVWWGLIGGGALVVLLVLRPLLARRPR